MADEAAEFRVEVQGVEGGLWLVVAVTTNSWEAITALRAMEGLLGRRVRIGAGKCGDDVLRGLNRASAVLSVDVSHLTTERGD